jgi:two-component system, NarL family, sensor histidine kinase UhpB
MTQNHRMDFRCWWIVALFCWPLWVTSSLAQAPIQAHAQPESQTQTLTQARLQWKSDEALPSMQHDAQSLPIQLPHLWSDPELSHQTSQRAGMQAWYSLEFAKPPGDLPAIYITRACTNLMLWVNGQLIGSGGSMNEPFTRNCYYPQLFTLPSSLLKANGNVLQIRLVGYAPREIAAKQRQAGLSEIQVGPEAQLRPQYDNRYFWNITMTQIIGVTLALMGMIFLMLSIGRKSDRHLFYFGLTLVGWAALSIRLYWQDIPLPGWASEIMIVSLFPPVVAVAILFLMHYVKRPKRWLAQALIVQTIAIPCILILMGKNWLYLLGSLVFTGLALEFLAALVYAGWYAWRLMRTDFWIVGSALLVAALLVAGEILIQNNWMALPRIHLIHFGMPLIFTAVTARLAQQFSRALTRSEQMSTELEQRVAEKAREIENNYEQISQLRVTEAASQERQRIASDLHDDLGARLLSLAQANPRDEHTSRMARQALDDMRLSVRGLTGQSAPAAVVLADWRAENMQRLQAAGLEADWLASEPPEHLQLGSRLQVQLTRILRETISNVIRHAKARQVLVELCFSPTDLTLRVHDDGRGFTPTASDSAASTPTAQRSGHGLLNIERRSRNLGGRHHFGHSHLGGALIEVQVPLQSDSQPIPLD